MVQNKGVPKESGAKDKNITVPFSLDGVNEGSRNDQVIGLLRLYDFKKC